MKHFSKIICLIAFHILSSCAEPECECVFPEQISNSYKVSITPKANFKINNDTIWVDGMVSSKIYDEGVNDSIFSKTIIKDVFSIYKLITPTDNYNAVAAIDNFKLIDQSNGIAFFESCKNATIIKNAILSKDSLSYTYRLGLIPEFSGSYVLSFQNSTLVNTNRNSAIVAAYPIKNLPGEIGFKSCDNYSWRVLKETNKEYYFKVTKD